MTKKRADSHANFAGLTAFLTQDQMMQSLNEKWKTPEISLLHKPDDIKVRLLGDDITTLAKMIQETLRSFRAEAEVRPEDISIGLTVIRFGIRPTGKPEMKMDEKSGKMVFVRDAAGNVVYESRTRVSRIMAPRSMSSPV